MRRNETFAICGNNYRINVCAETKRLQFVGIIIGSNVGAEMKRLQFVGIMIGVMLVPKRNVCNVWE